MGLWSGVMLAAGLLGFAADPVRIMPADCRTDAPLAPITAAWSSGDLRVTEFPVRLGARGVRNQVIAVRFDPRRVRLALDIARDGEDIAPWSIENAPADSRLALNAGQFTDDGPWGWVVHRGREWQAPGVGALAGAFVVDSSGRASVIDASEIPATRARGDVLEAVQSYPMLLTLRGDRAVAPSQLCTPDAGLDLTHRDTRLAIGTMASGETIVVLTRYELPGGTSSRFPIGPTTPEMSELMRRLGAVRAVMLDGGLSAQMLARAGSEVRKWPGLRRVPLALVARGEVEK